MLKRLCEHDFVSAVHLPVSGNNIDHDGTPCIQNLGETGTGHDLNLAEGFGQQDNLPAIEALLLDSSLRICALFGCAPTTLMNEIGGAGRNHPVRQTRCV